MKKVLLIAFFSVLVLFSFAPAVMAQTACVPGGGGSGQLCNPIDYAPNLETFVTTAIRIFTGFFAIAALVMVVYSGARMVMSQGNEEALTAAKSSLQWAISGLVLAMFAFVIVSAVRQFLSVKDLTGTDVGHAQPVNPIGVSNFYDLVTQMLNGFLGLVGLLAILMIIFAGYRYITSAGNEEQATSAKTTLQWSIIGLVIILLSYVIVRATLTFFV